MDLYLRMEFVCLYPIDCIHAFEFWVCFIEMVAVMLIFERLTSL